jgi:hypothetical protein
MVARGCEVALVEDACMADEPLHQAANEILSGVYFHVKSSEEVLKNIDKHNE